MKVIFNEIKKLFDIKIVAILSIIGIIIYSLFISHWIKYFPNGLPDKPHFELSELMLNEYGTTIDENEMEDFKNKTAELEREADKYILERKEFTDAGVNNYKDLVSGLTIKGDYDEKKMALNNKVMFENGGVYLFWELESRFNLIDIYSREYKSHLDGTKEEVDRIRSVMDSEEYNSVFNLVTFNNYNWLISNFSYLLIATLGGIISLIFIRDKLNKVNYLQNTSKVGRKLVSKKVTSAFITSFIVTTGELIFLFTMYSKNNTFQFWDCPVSGIFSSYVLWFDLTFGEYILITIGLLYILAFVVTCISMIVSQFAKSYINLIGIQVPILIGLAALISKFGLREIFAVGMPKYLVHMLYLILIIISIVLLIFVLRKEKKIDIE